MITRTTLTCPFCKRVNDAHQAADGSDKVPSDGDISLCIECAQPAKYADGGATLLPLTPEEHLEAIREEGVAIGMASILLAKAGIR